MQPEVQTSNLEESILYVDDNALMDRSRLVTKWSDENESDVETLLWPAQSTDLNIVEPLWCVLEERVRNLFFFYPHHGHCSARGLGKNPSNQCMIVICFYKMSQCCITAK